MSAAKIAICMTTLLAAQVALTPAQPQPSTEWHERDWNAWLVDRYESADDGVVTPDGSFVDLVTPTHAFELDYAAKWKEAIGQALFYGIATGRKPGIILLMGKQPRETETRYYLRCLAVCAKHDIRLDVVDMTRHLP